MVVGSIEVADQHAGEFVAQDLIHHGLASTTPQEVPLVWGAKSPQVAVVSVLRQPVSSAWTTGLARDLFQYVCHHSLGLTSHFAYGIHDGAPAEVQPVHGVQVPLDGA